MLGLLAGGAFAAVRYFEERQRDQLAASVGMPTIGDGLPTRDLRAEPNHRVLTISIANHSSVASHSPDNVIFTTVIDYSRRLVLAHDATTGQRWAVTESEQFVRENDAAPWVAIEDPNGDWRDHVTNSFGYYLTDLVKPEMVPYTAITAEQPVTDEPGATRRYDVNVDLKALRVNHPAAHRAWVRMFRPLQPNEPLELSIWTNEAGAVTKYVMHESMDRVVTITYSDTAPATDAPLSPTG